MTDEREAAEERFPTRRYGPSGVVNVFCATFDQHCESQAAALRGDIRINAWATTPTEMTTWGAIKNLYQSGL